MNIAFRVDASDAIGTGHLIRCLTLAEALKLQGHICQFIMRDLPGAPLNLPVSRGFHTSILPAPSANEPTDDDLAHADWLGVTRARDATETVSALNQTADWLVTDHYALDHRWHSELRSKANNILAIDDLANRIHDCDVLLDQNLQIAQDRYLGKIPGFCQALIGPQYALLRPEFAEHRKTAMANIRDSILVYMGGVDAPGATMLALQALAKAGLTARTIDVVVGTRNPHLDSITDWCAQHPTARLHIGHTDIAALMANAELAIGAAGASAWERCCLALPTVLITIAENQKPGAAALAKAGAAIWAGDIADVTIDRLAAILLTAVTAPGLRDGMAERAAALVDGAGVGRIFRVLFPPTITLRRAVSRDCVPMWQWRNDPETRKYIHDPQEIDFTSHQIWFENALTNPDRILLIGCRDDSPIGVLRFDLEGNTALISIYLVPGNAGKGFGTALLKSGIAWVQGNCPKISYINAEVLDQNQASLRAFNAAGFTRQMITFRKQLFVTTTGLSRS